MTQSTSHYDALTEFMRLYEDGKLGTDPEVITAYNEAVRASPQPVRSCNCYTLPHEPECSIFVGLTHTGERVEERRSGKDRRSNFAL